MGRKPIDTVNAFLALPDWRQRCLARQSYDNVSQKG
jgi:hypothetical protein